MRWFVSDLHFFHKNIGRYTDGKPLSERHNTMITMWNKHIKPKDIVWVIGDFSFGSFEETLIITKQLNGDKRLIWGNHDTRFTAADIVKLGFTDVRDYAFIPLSNEEKVLLSHYPYARNSIVRWYYRYVKQSPHREYYEHYARNCGRWLIHGHHHSGPKIKGKQINVTVDVNNFKPTSESELCQIINRSKNAYTVGSILKRIKKSLHKKTFKLW